jgi:hypothetical protein
MMNFTNQSSDDDHQHEYYDDHNYQIDFDNHLKIKRSITMINM